MALPVNNPQQGQVGGKRQSEGYLLEQPNKKQRKGNVEESAEALRPNIKNKTT